jgi:hypothetical protein
MKLIMPTKIAISLAFAYPQSIELPRPVAIIQGDHSPNRLSRAGQEQVQQAIQSTYADPASVDDTGSSATHGDPVQRAGG